MNEEAKPAPGRRRRKEARPGELLAAALDLFVERGFSSTRLDDVAARAGVTKGTLYLYFDNKEALFKAVVEHSIVPVVEEAERMFAQHQGSMAELLRDMLLGWWRLVGSTTLGGIPKLIMGEAGNFPEVAAYYHGAVIVRAQEVIRRVLDTGIARGEFRPIDVESGFHVIFAPLLMLALWRHSFAVCGKGVDPERVLNTSIDLTLHGLRTRPEGERK
ncbi:MAG: TetR/AcrR family transcriptional regulator [Rhodocyclaceae bacterium]|nr:MAG: TetR/AcrR family transcriptional regulator [Rhodocyclaceae bacterium]